MPLSPLAFPLDDDAHLTIVVGADRRIVRWTSSAGRQSTRSDITVTYGAAPESRPPPSDQIFVGSGPAHPDGEFVTLHSGTESGVQWTMERAPGTLGTQCWRVRTTPASRGAYGASMDDGYCVPPPAEADTNVDLYAEFPYFPGAGSPLEIFVMLTPTDAVVKAEAQLVDGRSVPAQVFAAEGLVVFVGDSDAPVWAMTVTDGEGVHDCSAYVYDVDAETPTTANEALEYRATVPIACLERFNQGRGGAAVTPGPSRR